VLILSERRNRHEFGCWIYQLPFEVVFEINRAFRFAKSVVGGLLVGHRKGQRFLARVLLSRLSGQRRPHEPSVCISGLCRLTHSPSCQLGFRRDLWISTGFRLPTKLPFPTQGSHTAGAPG